MQENEIETTWRERDTEQGKEDVMRCELTPCSYQSQIGWALYSIGPMRSAAAFLPSYSSPLLNMVLFSSGCCPLLLFDCHLPSFPAFEALHNKTIWWRGGKCLSWLTLIKVISVMGLSPFPFLIWQIQNDSTFSIELMAVSQQGTKQGVEEVSG